MKKATDGAAITMVFETGKATFRAIKNPAALYQGRPRGRCWLKLEKLEGTEWKQIRSESGRLSHLTFAEVFRTVGAPIDQN